MAERVGVELEWHTGGVSVIPPVLDNHLRLTEIKHWGYPVAASPVLLPEDSRQEYSFALEKLPGETWFSYLNDHKVPISDKLRISLQVAGQLESLYRKHGILVLDPNPHNIRVDYNLGVSLLPTIYHQQLTAVYYQEGNEVVAEPSEKARYNQLINEVILNHQEPDAIVSKALASLLVQPLRVASVNNERFRQPTDNYADRYKYTASDMLTRVSDGGLVPFKEAVGTVILWTSEVIE